MSESLMKFHSLKENMAWLRQVIWQQMGRGCDGDSPRHVIPSWRWALENAQHSNELSPWELHNAFCDPLLVELRQHYLLQGMFAGHPIEPRLAMTYEAFVHDRSQMAERYLPCQ